MGESKHTPGPWWTNGEYSEKEAGVAVIAANTNCGPLPGNPTRGLVAWVNELLPENATRCEANARLIASAPDLLAAVERAVDVLERAAGFLHWAATATPGITHAEAQSLLATWEEQTRQDAENIRAVLATVKGEGQ